MIYSAITVDFYILITLFIDITPIDIAPIDKMVILFIDWRGGGSAKADIFLYFRGRSLCVT